MGQIFSPLDVAAGPHVLLQKVRQPECLGVQLCIISDTHGQHRRLVMDSKPVDFLIHAGDFTHFGSREDAEDFNLWLGELLEKKMFKHCVVIEGNHEANAPWKDEVQTILSNATFLRNESVVIEGVSIHGKGFFWNMKTANPYDEAIPDNTDILIAHSPAKGYVDNDGGRLHGCASSALMVANKLPRIYVCGHVHFARGMQQVGSVLFVNGSNVTEARDSSDPESANMKGAETKGAIRGEGRMGERKYKMLAEGRPIMAGI